MGTGKFWYYGISEFLEILELVLRLFDSSKAVYWPILGTFSEFLNLKPFIIGLYFNENGAKPESIDDYLLEFIDELSYLLVDADIKIQYLNVGTFHLMLQPWHLLKIRKAIIRREVVKNARYKEEVSLEEFAFHK